MVRSRSSSAGMACEQLGGLGIGLEAAAEPLETEGVERFVTSFESLMQGPRSAVLKPVLQLRLQTDWRCRTVPSASGKATR